MKIYGTHGEHCEHFRFKRIAARANGYALWQQVKRFLIFWIPVGTPIYEHENNYFIIK